MFYPLMTSELGKFSNSRNTSAHSIDWVETKLISLAMKKNPKLLNTSKTKYEKEIYLRGLLRTPDKGPRYEEAKITRQLFR